MCPTLSLLRLAVGLTIRVNLYSQPSFSPRFVGSLVCAYLLGNLQPFLDAPDVRICLGTSDALVSPDYHLVKACCDLHPANVHGLPLSIFGYRGLLLFVCLALDQDASVLFRQGYCLALEFSAAEVGGIHAIYRRLATHIITIGDMSSRTFGLGGCPVAIEGIDRTIVVDPAREQVGNGFGAEFGLVLFNGENRLRHCGRCQCMK